MKKQPSIKKGGPIKSSIISHYYLCTPLFFIMDFYLGMNIRAVGLMDHPGWRTAYYGFCFLCWLLIWKKPSFTSWVGIGESVLNLLLLIIGLLMPYFSFIADIDAVENASQVITVQGVINFFIAGMICLHSYYSAMVRLRQNSKIQF